MLNFNERLKKLRREKDLTQEQLAEYMGVSPQAVSRWETGATCPDISALPLLAQLFGITVDALLGVDENETQRKVRAIVADAEKKIDGADAVTAIADLRVALDQYPGNDQLLCCLMYALYTASGDETLCKEYDSEIVTLYNRIQQYSTDNDCRNQARAFLFRHYCDTGRKAEALQVADGLPSIEICRERCMYWALEEKDRNAYLLERIKEDIHQLIWEWHALVANGGVDGGVPESTESIFQDFFKVFPFQNTRFRKEDRF